MDLHIPFIILVHTFSEWSPHSVELDGPHPKYSTKKKGKTQIFDYFILMFFLFHDRMRNVNFMFSYTWLFYRIQTIKGMTPGMRLYYIHVHETSMIVAPKTTRYIGHILHCLFTYDNNRYSGKNDQARIEQYFSHIWLQNIRPLNIILFCGRILLQIQGKTKHHYILT